MLGRLCLPACLVLVLLASCGLAAVYSGSLTTSDKWHYLSKFCCSNEFTSVCNLDYKFSTSNENLQLLMYLGYEPANASDPLGSWDEVYKHRPGTSGAWSCEKLASHHRENGVRNVNHEPGQVTMKQYQRAYFWFVALADCASNGIKVSDYHIEWTNPGGLWYKQFSFDQQGLGPIFVFFSLAYLVLFGVHGFGVWQQIRNDSWHPIVRILTFAIGFQFVSSLAEMLHYSIYAANGIGSPVLLGIGDLLIMAGEVVLMFQCILIAKGWAITTSYLSEKFIVLGVMGVLIISYLALFIWDKAVPDPASVLYFYESWPGVIVVVLRLGTWGWFVWSLRKTILLESLPEKRVFYIVFGASYTLWFLLLPLIIFISLFLAPWIRFRTVTALVATTNFLGLAALAFLLWPSRASKYFVIKASPQLLGSRDGPRYGAASSAYDATNAL